jgi:hypothetical protein
VPTRRRNRGDVVYLRSLERTVSEGEVRSVPPYRCGWCAVSVGSESCHARADIGLSPSTGERFPSFGIGHAGESPFRRQCPRVGVR